VETANRVAAATAAYDMAIKNNKTVAEAQAYALQIIQSTQGDSSRAGSPLILKKLPKVITQYRKYQLLMIAVYVKAARQAFFGADETTTAIGRRMLAYKLFHTAMAAGLLGLPLVNGAMWLFLALGGGDDDEPQDAERWLRNKIGDDDLADLILKGPGHYLGLSGKLAENKIFSITPFTDWDLSSKQKAMETAAGFLGPGVSQVAKFADAVGLMKEGNYYKGIEKTLPKGFESAMKAFRVGNDGFTMRNGDVMYKPDDINGLMLSLDAIGLKSPGMNRMEFVRGQQYMIKEYFKGRTTEINRAYLQASRDGDADSMSDLRDEWMKLQDGKDNLRSEFNDRSDELKRQPLSTLLKYPSTAAKREAKLQQSVPAPR